MPATLASPLPVKAYPRSRAYFRASGMPDTWAEALIRVRRAALTGAPS